MDSSNLPNPTPDEGVWVEPLPKPLPPVGRGRPRVDPANRSKGRRELPKGQVRAIEVLKRAGYTAPMIIRWLRTPVVQTWNISAKVAMQEPEKAKLPRWVVLWRLQEVDIPPNIEGIWRRFQSQFWTYRTRRCAVGGKDGVWSKEFFVILNDTRVFSWIEYLEAQYVGLLNTMILVERWDRVMADRKARGYYEAKIAQRKQWEAIAERLRASGQHVPEKRRLERAWDKLQARIEAGKV